MRLIAILLALTILAGCESHRTPPEIAASYLPSQAVALCIIGHESGGNPRAVSATGDYGLAQIHRRTWERTFTRLTGRPWLPAIFDPDLNGIMAREVYREQGWRAWSTHRLCGV